MTTLSIEARDERTFHVTVHGRSTTTHTVTVDPAYAARLTGGRLSTEALISRSFDFLLEREPNTSILQRFDLPLIGHYFPDYEAAIRAQLG